MVCAPNAFKGSLSAARAAGAMVRGVRGARPAADVVALPVADGGDGTLDVLLAAAGSGASISQHSVHDALGKPRMARLGLTGDGVYVVELAEAAGLRLLPAEGRDPLRASSRGAGELLAAALLALPAPRRIVVGVGGSASTDGGAGLLAALGVRLLDAQGRALAGGGGALLGLAAVDLRGLTRRPAGTTIDVACDTAAPLLGPRGAAAVFAPQKGATPADVETLERGLERLAEVLERDAGVPRALRDQPGAGAAGGCGYALAALCGASLVSGAALVCDAVGLDTAIAGAALVLTGEGRLDASTATGKAPAEVARRAAAAGVPCAAIAGGVEAGADRGFAAVIATGDGLPEEESRARAEELVELAAARLAAALLQ